MENTNIIPVDFSNVSSIQICGDHMSLDWDSDSMTGKLTAIAMEEIDQGTEHLFVNWFFDVQGDKGEQWCGLDDLISKECSLFRDVYDDNRGEMKIRAEMISCLMVPGQNGIQTKTEYNVWIEFAGDPVLSEDELIDIATPVSLEECYG